MGMNRASKNFSQIVLSRYLYRDGRLERHLPHMYSYVTTADNLKIVEYPPPFAGSSSILTWYILTAP